MALLAGGCSGLAGPQISLVRGASGGQRDLFEVRGLDRGYLESPAAGTADWSEVFLVHVDGAGVQGLEGLPSVLGSSRLEGDVLRFEPRFPLEPGVRYRARLHPGPWTGREAVEGSATEAIEGVFTLPPRSLEPKTVVARVYPSAGALPENLLKFYIHFSGPMRRGQAYEKIHLLDATGKKVDAPFLELGEELWDPIGARFTLFFDPGRIKRGLKPHDEVGQPLEAGKTYALVVDGDWLDADGAPLKGAFRKDFRVNDPDYDPPDPRSWSISPPAAGTNGPLVLAFSEPLDQALLVRLLRVRGPGGNFVEGEALVGPEEREWRFQPRDAWKAGRHEVLVETTLEDLAGNSVGRPFEVDSSLGIGTRLDPRSVPLLFEVREPGAPR